VGEVIAMLEITRGFYISLLASACILGLGGLFFQGSGAASQATVVVALVVGFTLLNVIDGLDRRHSRRPEHSDEDLTAPGESSSAPES